MASDALSREWWYRAAWLAPVLLAMGCLLLARAYLGLPSGHVSAPTGKAGGSAAGDPVPGDLDWSIFRGGGASGDESVRSAISERFRLAGTFFAFDTDAGDSRRAILDDLKTREQSIVSEHERLDEAEIVKIEQSSVLVRMGGREERLWLSFSQPSGSDAGKGGAPTTAAREAGVSGSAAAFGGKQIGENRWVFGRDALLEYYVRLREEPRRLVALFDSLKPLYNNEGAIEGYRLGVEGEQDFFDAVGLEQGDVVRRVNSMRMTNRRRAEYFIREFVADRANAFVLDIERGGRKQKLIYEVR